MGEINYIKSDDSLQPVKELTILYRVDEGITFNEKNGFYKFQNSMDGNKLKVFEYSSMDYRKVIRTYTFKDYFEIRIDWK